MKISRSVVLITSAGSHLGGTLATHFAQMGATLVMTDTNSTQLYKNVEACRKITKDVHLFSMTDYSQNSVDQLFKDIDFGLELVVDVLINNWLHAPLPTLIGNHTGEEFTRCLSDITTNLFSFSHSCAEQMRKHNQSGVIVNLLSNSETIDNHTFDNTSSIVSGLTKSWAKQLDPFHIRVGGVLPPNHDHTDDMGSSSLNMSMLCDELTRNTEYIVSNDYFSGRVITS
jgi:NAD(P)-dependent dehydrogenase (short-subunit alcohol dehydrogenase family)